MINWKKRCLLLEEYISYEFKKHVKDFKKWLKTTHPEIDYNEIDKYSKIAVLTGREK